MPPTPFHESERRRHTLEDFFEDLARANGEFLVHDDGYRVRRYAYGAVAAAARAFAARLQAAGITKGDAVLFWSENRPEWVAAFWGCLLAGAVVVPIDYRSSADFARRVALLVRARVALTGLDIAAGTGVESALPGVDAWPLHELDWNARQQPRRVPLSADDVAEVIFTSGATAEPKGVVISHRNLLANIEPVEREVLKYRKWGRPFFPLRFLNLLPLSHMFGQAMTTFIPPMLPGTVVFMHGYNPSEIVRQVKAHRVSVVTCVPKILDVLHEAIGPLLPPGEHRDASTSSGGRGEAPASPRVWGEASASSARTGLLARITRIARRWWHYRAVHRAFGPKFWSFVVGAAPLDRSLEESWSRLGFLVIQGYGLTETAPIVSLNHPFAAKKGSVGKAIGGIEIRIAEDGEILVRGENVSRGYVGGSAEDERAIRDGWFHTGDIGELDADGQLFVRGRKKEMIVRPDGLNVFPEDVERVLDSVPGVRESAVVGVRDDGEERVHGVLVADDGVDTDEVIRKANAQLAEHQRIRGLSRWPEGELPRTEGTRKLKRRVIRAWVENGVRPAVAAGGDGSAMRLLERFAGGRVVTPDTTIEELGLSSLDRVELLVALEQRFGAAIDEGALADARTVREIDALVSGASGQIAPTPHAAHDAARHRAADDSWSMPTWNRRLAARWARNASLATWVLPLARVFVRLRVEGLAHLEGLDQPVVFAANHQSHLDTPAVFAALPARWRYRVAVAMAKEFFAPHFHPSGHAWRERATSGVLYWLAALFFNAFPLPQREGGARLTLRYIGELLGEGWSVLIFPEGQRTEHGEVNRFRPGIGMIGARLSVPVVPVRLEGVDRVLHRSWKMARPGPVRVAFGPPIRWAGEDYESLARKVEAAVRRL